MAIKEMPFEGTVRMINVKGQVGETSHQCLFGMLKSDGSKSMGFVLNPKWDTAPEKYRALLGTLLAAATGRSRMTAFFMPDPINTPTVHRIAAVQGEPDKRKRVARRRMSTAGWSFVGFVDALHVGSNSTRSGFTLKATTGDVREWFVLDSLKAPKRSAAMLQLVAAACSAGIPVKVDSLPGGKGVRLAIELQIDL